MVRFFDHIVTGYLICIVFGVFDYVKLFESRVSMIASTTGMGTLLIFYAAVEMTWRRRTEGLLPPKRHDYAVLVLSILYTVICILSYINSGLISEYFLPLLQPIMILAIILSMVRSRRHVDEVLFVIYIFALISAAICVMASINPSLTEKVVFVEQEIYLDRIDGFDRSRVSLFGLNVNTLAYLIDLGIVLNSYYFIVRRSQSWKTAWYVFVLALMLAALVSLACRGAVLALGVALLILFMFAGRLKAACWRFSIVIVIMLMAYPVMFEGLTNRTLYDVDIRNVEPDTSLDLRMIGLAYSWQLFLQHPLLGIGDIDGTVPPGIYTCNHIHYVQLLAVYGIFSLLTFLALAYVIMKRLYRRSRHIRKGLSNGSISLPLLLLTLNVVFLYKGLFAPLFLPSWVVLYLSYGYLSVDSIQSLGPFRDDNLNIGNISI